MRVCVRELGGALGTDGRDGGWPPLPIRPQRYCDPASRVASLTGKREGGPATFLIGLSILVCSNIFAKRALQYKRPSNSLQLETICYKLYYFLMTQLPSITDEKRCFEWL